MSSTPPLTANDRYNSYIAHILELGVRLSPRGLPTRALYHVTLDNYDPHLLINRKALSRRLAEIEILQVLAGIGEQDLIAQIAPKANLSLFTAQSFYGPRIREQVPRLVKALHADPASRQAILIFGTQDETSSSDLPCTVSYQIQVNELGHLIGLINMRSSDAVWGLPYDLAVGGAILQAVGWCLDRVPETIIMHIGNAHIYEDTRDLAEAEGPELMFNLLLPDEERGEDPVKNWESVVAWANNHIDYVRAGGSPSNAFAWEEIQVKK